LTNEVIVNLDNCAREPIHIPGAIQPHGVLFVLTEPELAVVQVSENCKQILGLSAVEVQKSGLSTFLDAGQIELVRFALSSSDPEDNNPVKLQLNLGRGAAELDAVVHRHDGFSILELEPSTPANDTYFLDFFKTVSKVTSRLQAATTLNFLMDEAAEGFRQITGFDRVMIYRFAESGAGEVIAESKIEEAEPYLGLWYPATDIPEQARRMYILNPIRCIPDAGYKPVPLVPILNPISRRPTDLTHASLRSVSPIHCEYLKNMGVTGSMSVSLVRDGRLWGMVSCHHFSARYVPFESRKASTFLGQVLSGEIARREIEAESAYSAHSNATQAKFLELMAASPNLLPGLLNFEPNLLDLIPAAGVAVVNGEGVEVLGSTPDDAEIFSIVGALRAAGTPPTFATNTLKNHFVSAEGMTKSASGVIALTISLDPPKYVLFFRPEMAQTVTWSGDPNKPVIPTEDGFRLSPRKSFRCLERKGSRNVASVERGRGPRCE